MADDLAKMWENLSLTEEEDMDVVIRRETMEGMVVRGKLCIIGKLLSDRFVSKEILKKEMVWWWKPSGWLTFKVVGKNMFLLEFEYHWEKARVLEGKPWFFERSIFSVADFDRVTALTTIKFEKVPFWVRMFDLPHSCMGADIGHHIGSTVGFVEEVETDENRVG